MKKDECGAQYYALNVQWNPKKHSQEIKCLSIQENMIRVMIMTNQLPTNYYMTYKAANITYEPECNKWHVHQ